MTSSSAVTQNDPRQQGVEKNARAVLDTTVIVCQFLEAAMMINGGQHGDGVCPANTSVVSRCRLTRVEIYPEGCADTRFVNYAGDWILWRDMIWT